MLVAVFIPEFEEVVGEVLNMALLLRLFIFPTACVCYVSLTFYSENGYVMPFKSCKCEAHFTLLLDLFVPVEHFCKYIDQ